MQPISVSRSPIQLVVFLVGFFLIWIFRATQLIVIDEAIDSPAMRVAFSSLIKFLLWVVPAAIFAGWLRRTNPLVFLGINHNPSSRQWRVSLAITAAFLSTIFVLEIVAGRKSISSDSIAKLLSLSGLLSLALSPFMEEILFRGLVLRELAELAELAESLSSFKANVITSLLFVGIHLPYWLTHNGLTPITIQNSIGVFIFSMVAGWLYLHTRSIWPATIAHVGNNVVSSLWQ